VTSENIVRTIVRDELDRHLTELEERVAYGLRRSRQDVLKVVDMRLQASEREILGQLHENVAQVMQDLELIIEGSGVLDEIEQCAQEFLGHEDEVRLRRGISAALGQATQRIEELLTVRRDGREPIMAQVRAKLQSLVAKQKLIKEDLRLTLKQELPKTEAV